MASFNKVILVGNLTRDPQLSYLPNNTPVCEFGMATNRRWKSPDGEQKEETCFVDLTCFGKQAEPLNQYAKKGRRLLVEGYLKYHAWEAKDGSKRNRLTVVVNNFQFMDSAPARVGGGDGESGGYRQTVPAEPAVHGPPAQEDYPPPDYSGGGDVPF